MEIYQKLKHTCQVIGYTGLALLCAYSIGCSSAPVAKAKTPESQKAEAQRTLDLRLRDALVEYGRSEEKYDNSIKLKDELEKRLNEVNIYLENVGPKLKSKKAELEKVKAGILELEKGEK